MKYTIHEVAQLSGITIRTLHYYDEIALLKPSYVGSNGYRYYTQKELLLLQQILFFKELEFSLEDIKKMITAPHFNREEALKDQKQLLELKKQRLENILTTIDQQLQGGENMTTNDLYQGLSDEQLEKYKQEAKVRWGNTKAYQQSVERTRQWTKKDYERIAKEGMDITAAIAKVMDKGVQSKEVQTHIARHYAHISQFYDCSLEMYRNLGKMYVDDPRFTAYYEKFAPRLAVFMRDAIAYYCDIKKK